MNGTAAKKGSPHVINVILSGGTGSRLWPLSRKARPKQYLEIFDGESLFERTVKRNEAVADALFVVGNKENIDFSRQSLKKTGKPFTAIIETVPRNTAAAIAFAAFGADEEAVLLVTPADHLIEDENLYRDTIRKGIALAEDQAIVTFGIRPHQPETGYGYIEFDGNEVKVFHEKPDKEKAMAFLESGNFLWNSGIFCFKVSVFLEELKRYAPGVYEESLATWENREAGLLDEQRSLRIPSISVDYAVMEKSRRIKVVPSFFRWNDMGSFEALYHYFKNKGHQVDEKGNMCISFDASQTNTFFVGLEDCIFVATKDANLILRREEAQGVKELYKALEDKNSRLL